MQRERFVVPPHSRFSSLYNSRNEPNIGELINQALEALEEANPGKLSGEDGSGIFRNIDFNSSNLGDVKDKNTRLKNPILDFSLYGQEANGSTWALAVMNMFLHGMDNATIRWGDTIRNPKLREEEAEVDLKAVQERIAGIEKELAVVQGRMADYLKELGLN